MPTLTTQEARVKTRDSRETRDSRDSTTKPESRGYSFWTPPELGLAIEEAAKAEARSVSNWLRNAVIFKLRHDMQIRQAQARQMLVNQQQGK